MSKYDKRNYEGLSSAPYFVRVSCDGEVWDQTARSIGVARYVGASLAGQEAAVRGVVARWWVFARLPGGRFRSPSVLSGVVSPSGGLA